jgi:hypothetical protein
MHDSAVRFWLTQTKISTFATWLCQHVQRKLSDPSENFLQRVVYSYRKAQQTYRKKITSKKNVLKFNSSLEQILPQKNTDAIIKHIVSNFPDIRERDYTSLNSCLNQFDEFWKTMGFPNQLVLIKFLLHKLPTFYYRFGKLLAKLDLKYDQIVTLKGEIFAEGLKIEVDTKNNFLVSILTCSISLALKNNNLSKAVSFFNELGQEKYTYMNGGNAKLVHKVLGKYLCFLARELASVYFIPLYQFFQ